MQLWEKLKCYNFPYIRTRKINQDYVENFSGCIRQQGGNCLNPTLIQFLRAFKKLFKMKMLQHSDTQNCADTDHMLSLIGVSESSPFTSSEFIPSTYNFRYSQSRLL